MKNALNKIWFNDGILYSELHGGLTVDAMLDVQRQGAELVQQYNIDVVPIITIMTDVKNEGFKIKLHEFSKIITSVVTVNHASGIWLVGVDEKLRKKYEPFAKFFLSSRIRYVDTLEQAEAEARGLIGSD